VRALAEAERLGRESLTEVRSTVGLLRQDGEAGEAGAAAPLPGLGGMPLLVERFQSAGAEVTLTVDGDTDRLPATTGLAVYRIVQEALTNAIKHAPGAPIAVNLSVDTTSVALSVDSAGKPHHGSGLGMLSMRERAESLGGTCDAGPGGVGWLVRVALPLHAGWEWEAAP
jgi:signal transduction histidine kinase